MGWMRCLSVLWFLFVVGQAVAEAPLRRVALVIGNGAYSDLPAPLSSAKDATNVGQALRDAGFSSVTVLTNLNQQKMESAIKQFASDTAGADWAVVYYAGGGLRVEDTNFLMPTEIRPTVDLDIYRLAVPLQELIDATSKAKTLRLIFLDTLHETPLMQKLRKVSTTKSFADGLQKLPETDAYIVYAQRRQDAPSDQSDLPSPFAAAFLKNVKSSVELDLMLRRINADLETSTHGTQELKQSGNLPNRELYLMPARPTSSQAPASAVRRPVAHHPRPRVVVEKKDKPRRIVHVARRPVSVHHVERKVRLTKASKPSSKCFVFGGEKAC